MLPDDLEGWGCGSKESREKGEAGRAAQAGLPPRASLTWVGAWAAGGARNWEPALGSAAGQLRRVRGWQVSAQLRGPGLWRGYIWDVGSLRTKLWASGDILCTQVSQLHNLGVGGLELLSTGTVMDTK